MAAFGTGLGLGFYFMNTDGDEETGVERGSSKSGDSRNSNANREGGSEVCGCNPRLAAATRSLSMP